MGPQEEKFLVFVIHEGLVNGENMFAPLALVSEQEVAIRIAREFDASVGPYVMETEDHGVFVTKMEEGKLYSNRDPAMPFFERRFNQEGGCMIERILSF